MEPWHWVVLGVLAAGVALTLAVIAYVNRGR